MDAKEIRSLTGLRGIAACYVMVYHFRTGWTPPHAIAGLVNHGYLAVDLFFVLSGFVLTLTYGRRVATWAEYGGFLVKRLGRVYPLYLVATLGALILWHDVGSVSTLTANALLVQSWGLADPFLAPTWSISTELAAYIAFPALAIVMLRRTDTAALCAILAACALWWVSTRSDAFLSEEAADARGGPLDIYVSTTAFPLLRCFAGFALGMVAYRLSGLRRLQTALGWATAALGLTICGLLALPGTDVAIVLLCVPFVALLASAGGTIAAVLAWGPIYWLGLVSYSIYLDHRLVERALHDPVAKLLAASGIPHAFSLTIPVLGAVSIGCAGITYRLIEEPCRNAVRRLFNQQRTPIEEEVAAP